MHCQIFCLYTLLFAKVLSFGGWYVINHIVGIILAWSSDLELFHMEWFWTKGPNKGRMLTWALVGLLWLSSNSSGVKKEPFKGEEKKRGGGKAKQNSKKKGNWESRWPFVSSSMSVVSHIHNIFEVLKNGWSGKQILNLTRQKQVKTFLMTCLGGNTVSTIKKVLWYLCPWCVLQLMSEKKLMRKETRREMKY